MVSVARWASHMRWDKHTNAALARLFGLYQGPGILLNEHIAEDGPTVFEHACRLGADGIASKQVDGTH